MENRRLLLIALSFFISLTGYSSNQGVVIEGYSGDIIAGCLTKLSVSSKSKLFYDNYISTNYPMFPTSDITYYVGFRTVDGNTVSPWLYTPMNINPDESTEISVLFHRNNLKNEPRVVKVVAQIFASRQIGLYWNLGFDSNVFGNQFSNDFQAIKDFQAKEPFYCTKAPQQIIPTFQALVNRLNLCEISGITFDGSLNFTQSGGEYSLLFNIPKCGVYSFFVNGGFACPVTDEVVQFNDEIEFNIEAPPPVLSLSEFPNDKARLVSNCHEGVAYQWLKQPTSQYSEWDVLFSAPRGCVASLGNYKVKNFPIVPGCGYQESAVFSPTVDELRTSHLLETSARNSNIKTIDHVGSGVYVSPKDFSQSVTYLDNANRPFYKAAIGFGASGGDIVQFSLFDNLGRQVKTFLPYSYTGQQPGSLDPNPETSQSSFYGSNPDVAHDLQPFGIRAFTHSYEPFKATKEYGPGKVWKDADKFVSGDVYPYYTNDFTGHPVYRLIWGVPGNGWAEKALTDNNDANHQTYWSQELMVKESRTEDGQVAYSFMDIYGNMVAQRIMPFPGRQEFPQTTYYVYDDFGRLRMKVPPAVSIHFSNTSSILYSGNSFLQLAPDLTHQMGPLVMALCTRYEYDGKGRLIKEWKPGGGLIETVYDIMNRPVLSQDQTQRLDSDHQRWSFIKYDREGRQVYNGEIDLGATVKSREAWQEEANDVSFWYEQRDESSGAAPFQGYTNQAFPVLTGNFTLLTVDYYDNYTFKRGNSYEDTPFDPQNDLVWPTAWQTNLRPNLATDLKALHTGHKVRVLDEGNSWLLDIMIYDEKERLLATGSDNVFGMDGMGDEDWHFIQRNVPYGQVTYEYFSHSSNEDQSQLFSTPAKIHSIKRFTYNDRGQVEAVFMKMVPEEEKKILAYDYDVFGNVKTRHLCDGLQHIDYKRNIRGWLTHINSPDQLGSQLPVQPDEDLFALELKYENPNGAAFSAATVPPVGPPVPRFDGTITGQKWKSLSDQTARSYTYTYDAYNQVEKATYRAKKSTSAPWGAYENDMFHFSANYDHNGNIVRMEQNGPGSKADFETKAPAVTIDALDYSYNQPIANQPAYTDNQVKNVQDGAANGTYAKPTASTDRFRRDYNEDPNYAGDDLQYVYDAAGRLIKDLGKNIRQNIRYNILDLPEEIRFGQGPPQVPEDEVPKIKTLYAADGRKLRYTYEAGTGAEVITEYAGAYNYRWKSENKLFKTAEVLYRNTEVGKVVYMMQRAIEPDMLNEYWLHQYHIYDHQGNLRVAFQESYTKAEYEAGMEQINAEREEQEFDFVAETRSLDAAHSRTGNYLSMLNPLTGTPIGPMKWVAVEKGDTISMEAFAHFEASQTIQNNTWQQGLAGFLLGSLANSIYSPTLESGMPNPAYQQLVLLGTTLAAMGVGNLTQTDPTVPRAYLKYIHYDQDSQFVSQGIVPISNEASSSYESLFLQMVAQENGFVQFFIANESLNPVYFDDITGRVRRPKVIQEAHYNPFGLPLAGLTTLGNPEYAYFFTGKELYEDEALMWYDYGARMYDVQIGRWTSHDPEYQFASPYNYCGNNAVNYRDPDGRFVWFIPIALAVVGAYVGGSVANETANPIKWDFTSGKTWAGMGIGAAVGFGVGLGISYGLAAGGITTNAGFFTALGVYTPTCPGFALNGYAAAQLGPTAILGAGATAGTSALALGGTSAYYNIPGFADGLGAGLNAIGNGLAYAGQQIALAAAGGGAALAQVLTQPKTIPNLPKQGPRTINPWFVMPALGWEAGWNWAMNIETVNDRIASFLEFFGVSQDVLRDSFSEQDLDRRVGDLIPGSLKGSDSYFEEYADMTLRELIDWIRKNPNDMKARKMMKLIKERGRLIKKQKGIRR